MYTRLTLIATIRMQQGTKSYLLFRQEISRPGLEIRK